MTKLQSAPMMRRTLAFIFDYFILTIVPVILTETYFPSVIAKVKALDFFVTYWLYPVLSYGFSTLINAPLYRYKGGSIGKIIFRIKLVNEHDSYLSYKHIFYREFIGKIISSEIFYLGFICSFFRADHKAAHDIIFKTSVVENETITKTDDVIFKPMLPLGAAGILLLFMQVKYDLYMKFFPQLQNISQAFTSTSEIPQKSLIPEQPAPIVPPTPDATEMEKDSDQLEDEEEMDEPDPVIESKESEPQPVDLSTLSDAEKELIAIKEERQKHLQEQEHQQKINIQLQIEKLKKELDMEASWRPQNLSEFSLEALNSKEAQSYLFTMHPEKIKIYPSNAKFHPKLAAAFFKNNYAAYSFFTSLQQESDLIKRLNAKYKYMYSEEAYQKFRENLLVKISNNHCCGPSFSAKNSELAMQADYKLLSDPVFLEALLSAISSSPPTLSEVWNIYKNKFKYTPQMKKILFQMRKRSMFFNGKDVVPDELKKDINFMREWDQ